MISFGVFLVFLQVNMSYFGYKNEVYGLQLLDLQQDETATFMTKV